MPPESAAVPAGRFDGCVGARSEGAVGLEEHRRLLAPPGGPLSGLVRSQGIDRPFTMELVAFGMSSATADF